MTKSTGAHVERLLACGSSLSLRSLRERAHLPNDSGPGARTSVRRGVGQRRRLWDFNGPSLRRSRSCGINPAPRFGGAHGLLNDTQVIRPFHARNALELLDTAIKCSWHLLWCVEQ